MCVCPVIPWQSAHSSLLSLDNNSSPAHSVISLPSPPNPKTGQGLSFPNLRHQPLSLHTFQQPALSVQWAWSGLATEWPPYTSALSEMSSMSAWLQSTLHWMYTAGHFNEITACNPLIRGRGNAEGKMRENPISLFYFGSQCHARCLTETASFTKPVFELAFKVFYGLYFTVISSYWEREREKEGQNCQMIRNSLLASMTDVHFYTKYH